MSERRLGVLRLRHGAGVGVGHVCAEGTVHGPIVSGSHSGPKNLAKKNSETMVHCRLGIPERRVGDGRRCACYGYAAAARRRRSREYSFSCTPGWRPGVSRAALLHGRLQLSSAQPRAANLPTTAMLDTPLTHGCVHRTERVQQQPSATIIRCVQWMQRSRNHSQSLWRPACRPHSTHNHKPWVQFCTHACFTNHGLYTGCNFAPTTVLQTMVCIRGPICTPYTNHGLLANCVSCTNHGLYTGCKLHLLYQPGTIL
jgi:hypothetical protein